MKTGVNKKNLRWDAILESTLSDILEKQDYANRNTLITVTEVLTNTALTQAYVYVSIYPEKEAKDVLWQINKDVYKIQQIVNKKCQMRPVPKITFKLDRGPTKADEVEKLILENKKQQSKKS